uniref:Proteasome subunit beta n=1 Tax=Stegastes partitus TaxID=144197 RepID=A0A3B4ZUM3_9TELE
MKLTSSRSSHQRSCHQYKWPSRSQSGLPACPQTPSVGHVSRTNQHGGQQRLSDNFRCLSGFSTVRRPFPLSHGTTTLGFIFQGGVIAAADTRASAAGLVCCPAAHKINPIHSHLVVASSGSAADCMLWERILIREIRLYQLRHGRRLSIRGTAKLLSLMLHPFKVTDSASPNSGPKLVYVCSDGARLQGDIFSVGSGSPYAYGVLDGGLRWNLSKDEAFSLAREAVFRATHRDAYSGNNVDLFHITAQGWSQREREDLKEEYYRDMNYRKKMTCKL